MCAHGGTSDPLSRCKIKSKCIGNDAFGDRKSCDMLIRLTITDRDPMTNIT